MDRALPLAPGVNRGARIISNASGRAAAVAVTHAGAACSMVELVRTPAHPSALNCAIRREGALLPKTGIDGCNQGNKASIQAPAGETAPAQRQLASMGVGECVNCDRWLERLTHLSIPLPSHVPHRRFHPQLRLLPSVCAPSSGLQASHSEPAMPRLRAAATAAD